MTERTRASWLVYALGALCAGAIAAAILVVGPASGSQNSQSRTVTAAQGIVQSTVSGSGTLQPLNELNLGFKTSGTVTHVYVSQGQQVAPGQLLATLNPQSAEVTLEQSKATLKSAEANLAKQEETGGAGSTAPSSTSSSGAAASNTGAASTASVRRSTASEASTPSPGQATTPPASTSPGTQTKTAPSGATPTTTSPSRTTTTTTTTPTTTSPSKGTSTTHEPKETSSGSSSSSSSVSPATREANIASAKAAVSSDKLTVQSDEQAVQSTKLYAPDSGTIVSLSGQVGETVSGGGTTKASTTASSSGGSGSSTGGAGGASSSAARSGSGASSGSSSSSTSTGSSSSAFAVLGDLSSMQVVAPLSESEVGHVKVGQIATVTVEALEGRKLAAHVSEVAILSTSNSGVVSYNVTFQLDQMESGLKPGMSATAEAVVKQAEGVNVPTSAISAGTVTVVKNGKQTRRRVVTGLAGNSSTIILSGLNAGERVALPVSTSTTSALSGRGATSPGRGAGGLGRTGAIGGGLGGGGLGGGGFPGAGGP